MGMTTFVYRIIQNHTPAIQHILGAKTPPLRNAKPGNAGHVFLFRKMPGCSENMQGKIDMILHTYICQRHRFMHTPNKGPHSYTG